MPEHYTAYHDTVYLNRDHAAYFHVIRTGINNIRTETILKPLSETNFTGINGGFFTGPSYDQPPTAGRSIAFHIEDAGRLASGSTSVYRNWNYNGSSTNYKRHKTLILRNNADGTIAPQFQYVAKANDVLNQYSNVRQIIGGRDYNSENWSTTAYNVGTRRTVLAWTATQAYLITSTSAINIPDLKRAIELMGLSPTNSIILDGSGSTSMQVTSNSNLNLLGEDRHLFNCIRLARNF